MVASSYIAGVFLCATILLVMRIGGKFFLKEKRTYEKRFYCLFDTVIFYAIVNGIWGILLVNSKSVKHSLIIIVSAALYMLAGIVGIAWLTYIMNYLGQRNKNKFFAGINVGLILCAQLTVLIVNFVSLKFFYVDEAGNYRTGNSCAVLLLLLILPLIISIIDIGAETVKNRESGKRGRNVFLIFISILPIICQTLDFYYVDIPFTVGGFLAAVSMVFTFNVLPEVQDEIQERHKEKEEIYRTAFNADSAGYYEVNLTRDEIMGDIFEYNHGKDMPPSILDIPELKKPYLYSDFISWWANNMITDKKAEFEQLFKREKLIESYMKGELTKEFTYWSNTTAKEKHCYRQMFFLSKRAETNEIIALTVVHDITETAKKEAERYRYFSVINTLSDDYETIYIVDVESGKFDPIRRDNKAIDENKSKFSKLNFYAQVQDMDRLHIYEEDKEHFAEMMAKENIKAELEKNGEFSFTFRTLKGNEKVYYRAKFILMEKNAEGMKFLFGHQNVDSLMRKEMENVRLLKEARDQAQAANDAKSKFLFNMSHDIRTPMNAITGFTSMAEKYIDDKERVTDCLKKIEVSSNHLLKLINDVLDMSRIEAGNVIIEENACDIKDIVYRVMTIARGTATESNINLTMEMGKILHPAVYADILHIEQIIINVLSNAIKYTKPGGKVTLSVLERHTVKDGYGAYEFIVTDTGIGMARDFVDHIFEAFSREKSSTVSGVTGTGLGMSITKNLIDLMGGKIEIDSELGYGTKVTMLFEFRLNNGKKKPTEVIDHRLDNVVLFGRRVLLVEDNELNREIARDILIDEGLIVEEADDGAVAAEMVYKSQPGYYDFILMDIQMPYMDGYKATATIRNLENKELANIPIIAMTANAFDTDKAKSLEAGMNTHLTKPINIAQLINTLKSFASEADK